ncbi:ubiquitin-conjugating enzyme/RWD-like protein [Delphinella strobiligena]|nr:ubiquitin-conjugating enzyme/RWD-like protein [Delphinella strobiligena]
MGREDQQEEREVLDSIFPDEITDISETEYRIAVKLDVPLENEEEDDSPTILLSVQYPENYPDVAPRLDLSYPPNAPRYEHLDIQEDKARLLEVLEPTIEENLGMAMVFTLVTTLKEAAELLISERQRAIEVQEEAVKAEAEAEENRKFEGTKVTPESYLAWSAKFKQEMADLKKRVEEQKELEEKKKRGPKEEKKMTGKELWVKGIATRGADEEEEGAIDALEGMKSLKVEG